MTTVLLLAEVVAREGGLANSENSTTLGLRHRPLLCFFNVSCIPDLRLTKPHGEGDASSAHRAADRRVISRGAGPAGAAQAPPEADPLGMP